ncbi:radical SAM family heme chaperone HemW [Candidatus Proelusimicrobium excrementi]|uniref:radical SAM family heme chaperone HemW n=1 Tax=Candidatus Proelusimicrobium excrementi TaxID=3416222 RepID=UPI003CA24141|nr:radical SAM family heme chaperone HemW [Elusimicrobiaceae bacterium]
MLGLYIHIPFCVSKCFYCDFASYPGKTALIAPYLKALTKEAGFYKLKTKPGTVYVGGGTPSFLNEEQIKILLDFINANYGGGFKEFTFECNPESLNEDKLKILKEGGVNRLSLGLQSFNDKELKLIGRAHDAASFLKAYRLAVKYFDNINIDLIAALPGQTKDSFLTGLKEVLALKPKHISLYGLQVEEGTPLFRQGYSYDDDFYVDLLESAYQILTSHGFGQYEISNYAKPGRESMHNINYWLGGEYLGLGAAAGGYLGGERYGNITGIEEYISAVNKGEKPLAFKETLCGKAKIGERIMTAFRYLKGFKPDLQMLEYFGEDFKTLLKSGLIENDGENLKLSAKGKYFANQVFSRFVEPF